MQGRIRNWLSSLSSCKVIHFISQRLALVVLWWGNIWPSRAANGLLPSSRHTFPRLLCVTVSRCWLDCCILGRRWSVLASHLFLHSLLNLLHFFNFRNYLQRSWYFNASLGQWSCAFERSGSVHGSCSVAWWDLLLIERESITLKLSSISSIFGIDLSPDAGFIFHDEHLLILVSFLFDTFFVVKRSLVRVASSALETGYAAKVCLRIGI